MIECAEHITRISIPSWACVSSNLLPSLQLSPLDLEQNHRQVMCCQSRQQQVLSLYPQFYPFQISTNRHGTIDEHNLSRLSTKAPFGKYYNLVSEIFCVKQNLPTFFNIHGKYTYLLNIFCSNKIKSMCFGVRCQDVKLFFHRTIGHTTLIVQ